LAGNIGYQLASYLRGASWFSSGVNWLLERIGSGGIDCKSSVVVVTGDTSVSEVHTVKTIDKSQSADAASSASGSPHVHQLQPKSSPGSLLLCVINDDISVC